MKTLHLAFLLVVAVLLGCSSSTSGDSTADAGHDAGSADSGGFDGGGGTDGGGGVDAGSGDAGGGVDGGPGSDAGPVCSDSAPGACNGGLSCMQCPSGPIMVHYLCTTSCTSDGDCTDAARPHCNRDTMGTEPGLCTSATYACAWGVRCASPDTMIATPDGERTIASLVVGDLVYSVDHDALVAVPLLATRSLEAEPGHRVVRVTLATGRVVEMSAGHPTADGRTFGELGPGDAVEGAAIVSAESVPYAFARTYDVLPASDTGTYVAAGALVGSTLFVRP